MHLEKPLCFFDLETTGTQITSDKIVEIFILKVHPDQSTEERYHLINPQIPIPAEASAIHHITDDMVVNKPCFEDVASEIYAFIQDCDLAGYNSNKFDVPMLVEELRRANIHLNPNDINLIDIMKIYFLKEPRDLTSAYKYYCNKNLDNAHSAKADVWATFEIFKAQNEKYLDLPKDLKELSHMLRADKSGKRFLDLNQRFYELNGEFFMNFGKHKDKSFKEIAKSEKAYFRWILEKDFPADTKRALEDALKLIHISA
ncbi:MAG: 3'-5' exonuclease [Chitinophagales bacterium]|jgi:DNA polymerase-3 subunit epsilon|nr:3'-5' exonuclease [Chitinophagales bacterium]